MGRSEPGSADVVSALVRGIEVLEAFTGETPTMTLSEVAARTGVSPATARRSLITLEHLGYVQQVGRQFRLTPKVLHLGGAYFDSMSLAGLARPVLHELARSVGRACSLTVLDRDDVVYLAHVPASGGPSLRRHYVGARLPAHATSTGHVLLAALAPPDLQAYLARAPFTAYTRHTPTTAAELSSVVAAATEHGYAAVRDTVEYGAGALAVPVRDAAGEVMAALNVTLGVVRDRDLDDGLGLLSPLRAAAAELERALVRFPHVERTA